MVRRCWFACVNPERRDTSAEGWILLSGDSKAHKLINAWELCKYCALGNVK